MDPRIQKGSLNTHCIYQNLNGEITILHVANAPPSVYPQSQKVLDELLENYSKSSEKVFDDYRDLAEGQDIRINSKLVFGDPAKEIVKFSLKDGFDIIIIGNRGMNHLREMISGISGSVSYAVIHDTKCPVLLVKQSESFHW